MRFRARRSQRHRLAFGFALLIPLVTATSLAHAMPPDPLWIAGVYDAGDLDQIVVVVANASGVVNPAAPAAAYIIAHFGRFTQSVGTASSAVIQRAHSRS